MERPQKITLADMRGAGVRGLLIYCSDYHCSHWTAINGDRWPRPILRSVRSPASAPVNCNGSMMAAMVDSENIRSCTELVYVSIAGAEERMGEVCLGVAVAGVDTLIVMPTAILLM
jgi:hypothetical protein